jgi:hypothetical protein
MTFSTIEEDPEWFQTLSTNAKTKEDYLSKSCQARIRGYLSKAESQLKTNNWSKRNFEAKVGATTSDIVNGDRTTRASTVREYTGAQSLM